jgi:hypothetical protein
MTKLQSLALAYYRQRLQAVDPRLLFARWLVAHSRLTDFPDQPDRVEWWCTLGDWEPPVE